MLLGTGVCQVGGRASEEVDELGNEDGTKVGRSRQWFRSLEKRIPSNPWGTGLRMEYCSFVRKRLHFLLEVLLSLKSLLWTGT